MLSLSQTTGYAILALACLEEVQGNWVKVREINECTGIPLPYLSKLLHRLGQAGIVVAKRGTFGGYALACSPAEINLLEVAEAIEGETWMPRCLLGLSNCSDERACPTHAFWSKERARIESKLSRITLKEVAKYEHDRRDLQGSCCTPPVTARIQR